MHRRSLLGALLNASIALPLAAKAAVDAGLKQYLVSDKCRVNEDGSMSWAVRLDDNGNVAGFAQDLISLAASQNAGLT